MAYPSVTYTFSNSTTADATQVNQDFTDLINGMSDGTKDHNISALTAAGAATFNGAVTLGASTANLIVFNGSINSSIPINTNTTYDFGAATKGIKSVYIGGSSTYTVRLLGATQSASYTLTLPTTAGSFGQVLQTDGTGVTSWANSASSLGKNYIQYNNFENNLTTGWTLGTIGTLTNGLPTGTPTFGSGASGNLTIGTTASSIGGTYSMTYTSAAATTQGNMVASSSYAIDVEDQAKVLTVKFYYQATTNPSNCNFSGTSSNSFAWALYDVTNSVWLSSAGNFNLVQSSGCGYVTGTVQTGATTANIRLCVYNANATSGAATITLDDFYVGPQTAPSGPAMTDWNNNLTFTPVNFGTTTNSNFWWKREGDTAEVQGFFTSGTMAAATNSITLPFTIDSTKMASSTLGTLLGTFGFPPPGGANLFGGNNAGYVYYDGSTTGSVYFVTAASSAGVSGSKAAFSTSYNTTVFWVRFRVPISGWSSNTSMSADTDTRVCAALYTGSSTSVASGSTTNVAYTTKQFDTHAAFDGTTFTAPISGYYGVNSQILNVGSTGTSGAYIYQLKKNGVAYSYSTAQHTTANANYNLVISKVIQLNAGDTLLTTYNQNTGNTEALNGNDQYSWFSIQRVTGPAVIAATESVNASYSASGTQSINNNSSTAVSILTSKNWDSHNAFNTANGTYTAPVSGKYQMNYQIATNAAVTPSAVGNNLQAIFSGPVINLTGTTFTSSTGSQGVTAQVSGMLSLLAGQTVQCYISTTLTGAAVTFGAGIASFTFSIARVGN
jgi:hypothetical protein